MKTMRAALAAISTGSLLVVGSVIGAVGASAVAIQGDATATATATCTTLNGAAAVRVDSTITNGTNYQIFLDSVGISGAISVSPSLPAATLAATESTTLSQTLLEPISGSVTVTWTYHINAVDPTVTATVALPDCPQPTTTTAPTTTMAPATTVMPTTTVATAPATAAKPVTATPTYTG
jgi:hypothetical protein